MEKIKRTQQGKRHGPRHGFEQPALDCLQGKNRKICSHNDADGIENRPLHFVRGLANLFARTTAV